jgi:hypothetical protein
MADVTTEDLVKIACNFVKVAKKNTFDEKKLIKVLGLSEYKLVVDSKTIKVADQYFIHHPLNLGICFVGFGNTKAVSITTMKSILPEFVDIFVSDRRDYNVRNLENNTPGQSQMITLKLEQQRNLLYNFYRLMFSLEI